MLLKAFFPGQGEVYSDKDGVCSWVSKMAFCLSGVALAAVTLAGIFFQGAGVWITQVVLVVSFCGPRKQNHGT